MTPGIRHYIDLINEAQRDPLQNLEFKKWFNGSRVVDSSGQPLVVYHGTNSEFDTYNRAPIYFTPDRSVAVGYAMHRDNNPERLTLAPNVRPAYLRVTNPVVLNEAQLAALIADEDGKRNWAVLDITLSRRWQKNGHDGIYLKNVLDFAGWEENRFVDKRYDQWIVFSSDQIWPLYDTRPHPYVSPTYSYL